MRAGRAAKRKQLQTAFDNLERKVEMFGDEMRAEIHSLRAELTAGDRQREREQQDG